MRRHGGAAAGGLQREGHGGARWQQKQKQGFFLTSVLLFW